MRDEIKTGSTDGIMLEGMSVRQKAAASLLAGGIAVVLSIIPYIL
jgi:hypothetical protein